MLTSKQLIQNLKGSAKSENFSSFIPGKKCSSDKKNLVSDKLLNTNSNMFHKQQES